MDRIGAMKVFIATLDEGSLAGAGRRPGRSAAAVSRAIAFLEAHIGTALLHRTTRTIKLSEAGERYAAACRHGVLAHLEPLLRSTLATNALTRTKETAVAIAARSGVHRMTVAEHARIIDAALMGSPRQAGPFAIARSKSIQHASIKPAHPRSRPRRQADHR